MADVVPEAVEGPATAASRASSIDAGIEPAATGIEPAAAGADAAVCASAGRTRSSSHCAIAPL